MPECHGHAQVLGLFPYEQSLLQAARRAWSGTGACGTCLVNCEGAIAVDADVAEDTRVAVNGHSVLHRQQVEIL